MALAQNRLIAPMWAKLRTKVGIHFTRFAGVAVAALATSEILLAICDGVFHMTATPAALISTFSGAAVSYVLSRWAWERKGKPDVLRETLPFWVISTVVWVILLLATKLGYHIASWLGLRGFGHVVVVGSVYFLANVVTFLVRFVISDITPDSCHFEQAFSTDGGRSWEVNWIATDTRTTSAAYAMQ